MYINFLRFDIAPESSRCNAERDYNRCNRAKAHDGPHVELSEASDGSAFAVWDNDRTTDKED